MVAPTTIRSIVSARLDIPLLAPFGIAGGAQDIARNLLVTIELADGTRGFGEAAPFPVFNGETQQLAGAAVQTARSIVEGADVREWRRIGLILRETIGPIGSAQCALETAILDALTRHMGIPLWSFFGGVRSSLETDMTITTGTIEQAQAAARDILARNIRTIKIKVGTGDLSLDTARVVAVHHVAPTLPLILDGNCGYTADTALQLLAALKGQGIHPVLFEQPVPRGNWEEMRQIARQGGVLLAADESVAGSRDVLQVIQEQAAQVVNIKLMKTGIVEALDIAAICRAAGLQLMIGGMVESILAMTTSACFAAGLGGFRFVDLDTPLFMAENPFDGGFVQHGGLLMLDQIVAGHGILPRSL